MPELPEVETVARQLAPFVTGRRALGLELFDAKLELGAPSAAVAGRMVRGVSRVGKQVVIDLGTDAPEDAPVGTPLWLCVHLRMTGRLIWVPEAGGEPSLEPIALAPPYAPIRARLALEGGFVLFKDVRRFGTMRLLAAVVAPCGIDPFGADYTPANFAACLTGSRQPLKPWLLRQDRLVGMGNIYASEALFDARLSPFRPAGSLEKKEIRRLHDSILRILTKGIECGGTTFSDFQNARGESGGFQKMLKVYARPGQPCPHCQSKIERAVQAGRSTFYCPRCQGLI